MEAIPTESEGEFEVRVCVGCFGKMETLERERGDYIQVANINGIILNRPGYISAFGRIPEEMKIDSGISFLLPCQPFKYPKSLPPHLLLGYGFRQSLEFNMSCGMIWKEEWDYGDDIHEQPTVLRIEVNMTPTLGIWKGLGSWHPLHSVGSIKRYICDATKEIMVFRSPTSGHELVAVDTGALVSVGPNMGLIMKEPEIIAAVGGIPDEHKIIGGISFLIPTPVFMFPTALIEDPKKRLEVDSRNGNYEQLCRTRFMQAYKDAKEGQPGPVLGGVRSPYGKNILDFTEVNIPVSGEAGIEQLFNSFWSFFSHSILQPLEEKIQDRSYYAKLCEAAFEGSNQIVPILGPTEHKEFLEYYAYKYLVVRAVRKKPLIRIGDSVPCEDVFLKEEDFFSLESHQQ